MTRSEKIAANKIDKRVESAYYAKCCNIQIPMMEIPKIFAYGKTLIVGGASQEELEAGIFAYVQKIAA